MIHKSDKLPDAEIVVAISTAISYRQFRHLKVTPWKENKLKQAQYRASSVNAVTGI
jgi:hypothetical protein